MIIKPSILNATGIAFFSYLLRWAAVLAMPLITYLVILSRRPEMLGAYVVQRDWAITYYAAICLILTLMALGPKIFRLTRMTYIFDKDHFEKRYDFLNSETESIEYKKIARIDLDKSVWDKITDAADIIVHTASERDPDVILEYVRDAEEVRQFLHKRAGKP